MKLSVELRGENFRGILFIFHGGKSGYLQSDQKYLQTVFDKNVKIKRITDRKPVEGAR